MKRTEISEIGGEFGLINRINAVNKIQVPSTVKAIGDDAAVIDAGDFYWVLSTDMLIEGVHFDLAYTPFKHLGFKAVAVNVSDIAAMNAIPTQLTISIAVSNRIPVEALDEFYEGVRLACDVYKVDLVGGDTTGSRSGFVVSVSVLGKAEKETITYRNGAKPNDILCVTGDLGAAYLGLQVLEREKQVYLANPNMQPDITEHEYAVGRQLKPDARMDVILKLRKAGVVPTSMIDISDGLASEVLHLCEQSGVGMRVFEENLPIADATMLTATELKLNPMTSALNGGEDYELLMTISQTDYEKVKGMVGISPIGFVTEDRQAFLAMKSGELIQLKAQGWQHLGGQQ